MKQLLQDLVNEIDALRRTNQILQAKVDTMELFASIHRTMPAGRAEGFAPDIAWEARKKIAELEEAERSALRKAPSDA